MDRSLPRPAVALAVICGCYTGPQVDRNSSVTPTTEAAPAEPEGAERPSDTGDAQDATSFDTPTVCTSDRRWTRGDRGSQSMHPGAACIDCHDSRDEGPRYGIAGTVYPTAHEPDDCNGASGSISVVITDAKGKRHSLAVNSAGNFFSRETIAMPYTAKVVSEGKTRAMVTAQRNGDCNSCHTEEGTEDAPGRIVTP